MLSDTHKTGATNESGRAACRRPDRVWLAAQSQPLHHFLVFLRFGGLQIIEQLAALVDHLHQPATRRVIALVRGEMTAETADALGQQCNLDFRGSCVRSAAAILREDAALFLSR